MNKIKVLDQDTANKIAAGEVIERPLSVVKELVENSLDSGASKISIEIKDGGVSAITVSDNGCGMDAENAPQAFLRHATSKLNRVEDLFGLATLGFRGEALPSIAAVSKVTMVTRTASQDSGIKISLDGGKIIETSTVGCPQGTKITVRDLFYNTPARKKHLRGAAAETAQISDVITRLALSRPDVKFKLISQNRILIETPGNGKLIDTIVAVYGVQVAKKMLPVEGQGNGMHISGYVSKPDLNRATRTYQTILVNGRYVKSKVISEALLQGYHPLLSSKRYPVAVLVLEMIPGMVDVNVHPAKMEVRISHENELTKLLTSSVQRAVRRLVAVPQLEEQIPVQNVHPPTENNTGSNKQIELVLDNQRVANSDFRVFTEKVPQELDIQPVNKVEEKESTYSAVKDKEILSTLLPLGQLMPTYILAQGANGLFIIDQHAAHERVLYEQYLKQDDGNSSQMLLAPVVLELNHQEAQILTEKIVVFRNIGFILEHFGGNTYMLRGVPASFPPGNETSFFYDVLDSSGDDFTHMLKAKLACHSAIRAGQKLTVDEMQTLINQLSETENPYSCPHGRPTIINLSFNELNKRFKR
ncbi:DNA mismatch repair endonuclease MutL [Desulfofalx alkaliphila]|uniref:DNA mismatch repair endonuclease MutL n=1 Tax=Desulfofalx alkaliphila TaxID=105483 RepID=UPI0004E105F0|nr:DNA mismatch repair endonuclease MutL [Desulfofalx alkaliphila]